jgi:hypothetical protein
MDSGGVDGEGYVGAGIDQEGSRQWAVVSGQAATSADDLHHFVG